MRILQFAPLYGRFPLCWDKTGRAFYILAYTEAVIILYKKIKKVFPPLIVPQLYIILNANVIWTIKKKIIIMINKVNEDAFKWERGVVVAERGGQNRTRFT